MSENPDPMSLENHWLLVRIWRLHVRSDCQRLRNLLPKTGYLRKVLLDFWAALGASFTFKQGAKHVWKNPVWCKHVRTIRSHVTCGSLRLEIVLTAKVGEPRAEGQQPEKSSLGGTVWNPSLRASGFQRFDIAPWVFEPNFVFWSLHIQAPGPKMTMHMSHVMCDSGSLSFACLRNPKEKMNWVALKRKRSENRSLRGMCSLWFSLVISLSELFYNSVRIWSLMTVLLFQRDVKTALGTSTANHTLWSGQNFERVVTLTSARGRAC